MLRTVSLLHKQALEGTNTVWWVLKLFCLLRSPGHQPGLASNLWSTPRQSKGQLRQNPRADGTKPVVS